jgi:hypothetical protein
VIKAKQLNPDDLRKLLVAAWHNAAACSILRVIGKVIAVGWGSAPTPTRV